jgi:hypothetical protein
MSEKNIKEQKFQELLDNIKLDNIKKKKKIIIKNRNIRLVRPTLVHPPLSPPTLVPPTLSPPTLVPPTLSPPTLSPPTLSPPTLSPPKLYHPTLYHPTLSHPTLYHPIQPKMPPWRPPWRRSFSAVRAAADLVGGREGAALPMWAISRPDDNSEIEEVGVDVSMLLEYIKNGESDVFESLSDIEKELLECLGLLSTPALPQRVSPPTLSPKITKNIKKIPSSTYNKKGGLLTAVILSSILALSNITPNIGLPDYNFFPNYIDPLYKPFIEQISINKAEIEYVPYIYREVLMEQAIEKKKHDDILFKIIEGKKLNDERLEKTKNNYMEMRYKKDPNFNETAFWEARYNNAEID